ncbi:hypothetical protein AXF42_Ash000101 [Apostasia shenzhenica]|uniref:Late embryogenesis abundant protein LEA-2 subgroup domain-containing protein n=1 Tax=Apostasia shenzhenica TaxID=1088818 RepID=A0A2I0AFF5_9ASPA|nr:hypothetical protein AXF42_Ash000101 [Apostasia shenzhenica]
MPTSTMGGSPEASLEQSQPLIPPPPAAPSFGIPVPCHPPYEDQPAAYLLLPVYTLRRRRRNRCCRFCCLPAISSSSSLLVILFSLLLFASVCFLLWPSDLELSVVGLRLNHFRVVPLPSASIDVRMGLDIKIRNPDLFEIDYNSIVASIFYRGEQLGSVTSLGGRVPARAVSYVDADLHLDGVRILGDVIYLIGDVAKGSIPFETVTEVRGKLRFFFAEVPVKGSFSCLVHVNPDDQTISHQDCYRQ